MDQQTAGQSLLYLPSDLNAKGFDRMVSSSSLGVNLAEEAGILAGNGYLFYDPRNYHAGFDIYGNLHDDFPYLQYYVRPLIEGLNNVKARTYVHPLSSTFLLRVSSLRVLRAKANSGLPVGRKLALQIPARILGDPLLFYRFVRGLFDIEGTLRFHKDNRGSHRYPVLECEMADSMFIKETHQELQRLGFHFSTSKRTAEKARANEKLKAKVYSSGWSNLNSWLRNVGLNNPKHLSKRLVCEMYAACPPFTSLDERLLMIAGNSSPHSSWKETERKRTTYETSHELLILRICQEPRSLNGLRKKMKSRLILTEHVPRHLKKTGKIRVRRNNKELVVATAESGRRRIEETFKGWKKLERAYNIPVPASPSYHPTTFD